jgi:hypothetical protein
MKTKILVILVAVTLVLLSCQDEKECTTENDNQITLPNGDFLTIPACWKHEILQGIDSYVGQITYEKENIFIMYDMGSMAGSYVDSASNNIIIENSVNEVFWYEVVDREYLNDENCCVFITFPERGPANFITPNDENFNEVLEILKTYTSN